MYPIELETERLLIREFSPEDIDLVLHYESEPRGIFFHERSGVTRAHVEEWLDHLLAAAQEPERSRHQFAVDLRYMK